MVADVSRQVFITTVDNIFLNFFHLLKCTFLHKMFKLSTCETYFIFSLLKGRNHCYAYKTIHFKMIYLKLLEYLCLKKNNKIQMSSILAWDSKLIEDFRMAANKEQFYVRLLFCQKNIDEKYYYVVRLHIERAWNWSRWK